MSCDYAVWQSERPLTDDEAGRIYQRLCESWPHLEGHSPELQAFYDELTARWPEIDTLPEDRVGDFDYCPWSCALDHSGMAVVMACVWPKANKVGDFVQQLAAKHGLVFYDPQSDLVIMPARLTSLTCPTSPGSPPSSKGGFLARLFGRERQN
jgi:hypothetical protein